MNTARTRNASLALVAALFVLLIVLDQLGYLVPLRTSFYVLAQPLQRITRLVAFQIREAIQPQSSLDTLQQENTWLRTEINRLLIENIQLREIERENQTLRELLNYTRNNSNLDYQAASIVGRVIGSDLSNLLYTAFIDVGARDGIAKDMPVITHRGLVGRIIQVNPNSAQVLLLIDPASSVNAIIQTSRVEGIIHGELGGTLVMERIPQGETVSPGELVLTSGLGGTFPDKIVIGQIVEVIQQDLDLFQSARVRSTINFAELETVLVLTGFQRTELQQELLELEEIEN